MCDIGVKLGRALDAGNDTLEAIFFEVGDQDDDHSLVLHERLEVVVLVLVEGFVHLSDMCLRLLVFNFCHFLWVDHAAENQIQLFLSHIQSKHLSLRKFELYELADALLVKGRAVHALFSLKLNPFIQFFCVEFSNVSE